MSKIKDEIVLKATKNGHYIVESKGETTAHTTLQLTVEAIANLINWERWSMGLPLLKFNIKIDEKEIPKEIPKEKPEPIPYLGTL